MYRRNKMLLQKSRTHWGLGGLMCCNNELIWY
jgi:hypothetical protein